MFPIQPLRPIIPNKMSGDGIPGGTPVYRFTDVPIDCNVPINCNEIFVCRGLTT